MQNTPYLIPCFISITLTLSAAVYALRHRKNPAAVPFIAMCLFATWWTAGYVFELSSLSFDVKFLAVKLEYIGILGVPLSWTAFALAYTGRRHWLTTRNIALASIMPIITLVILWTTERNHMMFRELGLITDKASGLILIWNPPGWWFWVHALYIYGILLLGTIFLIQQFLESRDVFRTQALITIIAILTPWIANGLVVFRLLPIQIDITSVTFSISILLLGWGIFRYRLLDIIPIAYHAVFESISDAVIILDRDLRVIEMNPAALTLFDIKKNAAIGERFHETFGQWLNLDNKMLQTPAFHKEIMLANDSTPVRWLDLFMSTLREGGNRTGGYIITLRDVTGLKENESALAIARDEAMQANNFKTQLLANVSHELRTPLGIIVGYIDLMARGTYGDINAKQSTTLERIRESTLYLDGLVSEMLDQAQLDAGKLRLESASFEPREVFGQVCTHLSVLAESKNLAFNVDISNDLPETMVGDSQRLKQILVNLLSNAIKFTEQGGIKVKISRISPTNWGMQVSDTGYGIPAGAAAAIFEPFKQLDPARKTLRKGYGLGLSITKQIVRLMGGNIEMESEPDKGTTFTIILPFNMTTE